MAEPRAHRRVWWDPTSCGSTTCSSLLEVPPRHLPPQRDAANDDDFTKLDQVLDQVLDLVVKDHGFRLGFELMGNPLFAAAPAPAPASAAAAAPSSSTAASAASVSPSPPPSPSGTPPGLFTDWRDAAQLGSRRRMVAAVASRYVGRYGVDVVKRWRWEGWNELQDEPDHHCNTTRCVHMSFVEHVFRDCNQVHSIFLKYNGSVH